MPRLIGVFAGRTLILLVLSYHGSFSGKLIFTAECALIETLKTLLNLSFNFWTVEGAFILFYLEKDWGGGGRLSKQGHLNDDYGIPIVTIKRKHKNKTGSY